MTADRRARYPVFTLTAVLVAAGCSKKVPQAPQIEPVAAPAAGEPDPGVVAAGPAAITIGERVAVREAVPDLAAGQTLIGTRRALLGPRERSINSLAFSPDGRWLFTGGDPAVVAWDLRTGQVAHRLPVLDPKGFHTADVYAVSSDGKALATSGPSGELWVWDLAAGTHRSLRGKGRVNRAAFTADGKTLFTLHPDAVSSWDIATGRLKGTSDAVADYVLRGGLAATPDGQTVSTGGKDGALVLLDGDTLREKKRLPGHKGAICFAALSPDGKTLATVGSDDPQVKLWDVRAGTEIRSLKADTKTFTQLAFSPSGRYLAAGGGGVVIWDVASGTMLETVSEYTGNVDGMAFSPDGAVLATGRAGEPGLLLWDVSPTLAVRKGTKSKGLRLLAVSPGATKYAAEAAEAVEVRDSATGKLDRTFPGLTGHSVFSPDGKLLARADGDKLLLADVATGTTQATPALEDGLRRIAFSPGGKRVALGLNNWTEVWTLGPGGPVRLSKTERTPDFPRARAFSPDGKTVAAGIGFAVVAVSAETGKTMWSAPAHESHVETVAFSADGTRVLSAARGSEGTARLWDAATGTEVAVLRHDSSPNRFQPRDAAYYLDSAFFGPDPGTVVTFTGDDTLHLWDAATGRRLGTRTARDTFGWPLFAPDGKTVVCAAASGTDFWAWEVAAFTRAAFAPGGQIVRNAAPPPAALSHVPVRAAHQMKEESSARFCAYSADGSRLLVVNGEGSVVVWDAATGKRVNHFSAKGGEVAGVALSHDGRRLALAQPDRSIRLWDVDAGREVLKLVGHGDSARHAAYSPDGKWLATGYGDFDRPELFLWDAATGALVKKLAPAKWIGDIRFSPDGKWLVAGTSKGGWVYDTVSHSERATLPHPAERPTHAAVSPDGRLVALGGDASRAASLTDVTVWDAASGKHLHTLAGHDRGVWALAFGADGLLVVQAIDTYLWDTTSGKLICRVPYVGQAAVSPDGRTLAGYDGKRVNLIDLATARDPRAHTALAPAVALRARFDREMPGTHVRFQVRGPDSLAALAALKLFPGTLSLSLDRTETMPAAAVRAIGELTALRGLGVNSPGLTDDHLKAIAALPELTDLDLSGCRSLTPAGLAGLARSAKLERLVLVNTQANVATLRALAGLKNLRALDLRDTPTDDEGVAVLGPFPALAEPGLDFGRVTDAGYAKLAALKSVRKLWLTRSGIDPEGLAHLKGLTGLEVLDLGGTGLDDASAAHLKGLTNLARLDVSGTRLTDAGFVHLKGMTKLVSLNLDDLAKVTGTGLAHLSGAAGLTDLDLRATGATDAGLAGLKDWTHLQTLELPDRITDAGLLHLEKLTRLEFVNLEDLKDLKGPGLAGLRNCRIDDLNLTGLKAANLDLVGLREWKALRSVTLPKTATDAGLANLAGLTGLRALSAEDAAGVTDAGLVHLKGLTKLASLDLGGTGITDAGLAHLSGLKDLQFLRTYRTGVTDEGRKRTRTSLPGADIR